MRDDVEHLRGAPYGIDEVLTTWKLTSRATRTPDFESENRALVALTLGMATNSGRLLQKIADTVLDVCRAGSAGISILEPGDGEMGVFRWHATAGAAIHINGSTMPCEARSCGIVFARDSILLLDRPERLFPSLRGSGPPIYESLLAPFHVDGKPIGTVWAMAHSPEHAFDAEDRRLLESLAGFASAAFKMATALEAAELGRRALAEQVDSRTKAERARREDETRLRKTLEISTVGVIFFDISGVITDANDAFLRMGGYSREDLATRALRWNELTPPEWMPASVYANEEIRTKGSSTPYEKEYFRKDGSRWFGLFTARALGEHNGVEFVIDVTESKRAEAALRKSDARLVRLLEMTPAGVVELDAEGRFTYANAAAEKVFGAELGELTGYRHDDPAWQASAGDGAPLAPECLPIAEALRGKEVRDQELLVTALDGRRVALLLDVTPVRDGEGQIEGALAAFQDVSARHQAVHALRVSEERLRALVQASSQVIYSMNSDWTEMRQLAGGNFLSSSDSSNQIWLADYIHPDDQLRVTAAVQEAVRTKGVFELEHRVWRVDGSLGWALSRAVPLLDRFGAVKEWFGAASDVTARAEAENALRQAKETLETRVAQRTAELMAIEATLRQSQKMEAVGQLTGGIAHDFNNMLQAISGSLEMLRRRVAQGRTQEAERFVEGASQTVERAAALTHRLLAFARRQTLQPKPVDPNELIGGMTELIQRTLGPSVAVELLMDESTWCVLCDPSQLENVLLNLAINARDAMPKGGRLTIGTACQVLGSADVAGQEGAKPGNYVEISVTDTGTGMNEAIMARAFDPFFTTKPLGQGTGLGLSQIYGFVRQSGGIIRLDSAPGRGTTVRFHLPQYEMASNANLTGPIVEKDAPQAGPGGTVLLVEDEAQVRKVVAEQLRELGYQVLEAEDGSAALRMLHDDYGSRVDLLITDVGLPGGLNGRQVADAVRERKPSMPVLFITGYAGSVLDGQLAPGMEVIAKPFALAALASRVGNLIDAPLGVHSKYN